MLDVKQIDSLAPIPAADWNRLNETGNPFLWHEYLHGLERYGCLDDHGWFPCHLVAFQDGQLTGALPLYLRTNSYGEFVFDWAWADAFEQAGGRYYPKLVSAIPFAPVLGPRLLVPTGHTGAAVRAALLDRVNDVIEDSGMSSFHCLFVEEPDHADLVRAGCLTRLTCQYRWWNRGYRDFQDFLDSLASKKRKQLRRERRQVAENDIEIELLTGDRISDKQWRVFHRFYCSTFLRRWGTPRLTLDFFQSLSQTLPAAVLLTLARHRGEYVAGAFSMLGPDTVYGRHWGCSAELPFLHFELCYYQTIEYCIRHRLGCVDAGVQGEHKLSRGFEPIAAHSFHRIRHRGFRDAIDNYLQRETTEMQRYLESLSRHVPYKAPR